MTLIKKIQKRIKTVLRTKSPMAFAEISRLKISVHAFQFVTTRKDTNGDLLLDHSIRNGNKELFKYLLHVNSRDNTLDNLKRLLTESVQFGEVKICQYILEQYEGVLSNLENIRDSDCKSLLTLSVESGNIDMVRYMLPKFKCIQRASVRVAAMICQTDTLDLFYNRNNSILSLGINEKRQNILHIASKFPGTRLLNWVLEKNECPFNCRDAKGKFPLYYIFRKGHLSHLNMIMKKKLRRLF